MSGYIYYLSWFKEVSKLNANIVDTDQRSHSVASDLGLHCLPMSILSVAKLKLIYFLSSEQIIMKSVKLNTLLETNSSACYPIYIKQAQPTMCWYTHKSVIIALLLNATVYYRTLFVGFFSIWYLRF